MAEARLVGIGKPKQQLISQLLEGDSQFKVVSVVGMGGVGKTTLVKKVHEDADVRRHFSIRAWVTVSQTFDFQDLLKSLIHQLHAEVKKPVPQSIHSMTTFELKAFVKDFLQEGRYAIVFDDVWDVEFWNEIKLVLPENNYGNRVMLTTRIADVASASCIETQSYVHKMQPLSFEESWILFCNKTFEDKSCPAHLRDVAEAILSKCQGLPLAIVVISGLLAMKGVSRIDEWEITRRSLGCELEDTDKLCLSYNNLPAHLKTCLLYISIYPEDYEISCFQITQLWIAERFVVQREGMTIEDVARDYLRERIDRSLIQVTSVRFEGMPDILELSYRHLPDYLKPCFLYLGAFAENKEIPVGKLTWLWIAEGFIQTRGVESMEDTAEEYLRDLIDSSLVMVSKRRSDGGVKTCRVHDMLRTFCLLRCEEDAFLQWNNGYDDLYSSYGNLNYGVALNYSYPTNAKSCERYLLHSLLMYISLSSTFFFHERLVVYFLDFYYMNIY